jgi:hypothetical protein
MTFRHHSGMACGALSPFDPETIKHRDCQTNPAAAGRAWRCRISVATLDQVHAQQIYTEKLELFRLIPSAQPSPRCCQRC